MNKRQRKPKGQSKMGKTKKLVTHDEEKKTKHNTICVGHHYMQANTNNVIKYNNSKLIF